MSGQSIDPLTAIQRAKPYLDAGCDPKKWTPSALLTIGYSAISTTGHPGATERADAFVIDMLGEARNRYAAGFFANPFEEPARARDCEAGDE